LGEFHLEAAFRGTCPAGEDVEDKLSPVDDSRGSATLAHGPLDIALLCGRQIVVHNDHVGVESFDELSDFRDLAITEQRGGVHIGPNLEDLTRNKGAGA
jgi:hypothetical protein